jgi:hypothetical protein
MRVDILRIFITHLLVHIHQKKKIALEIAAKIASVNGPAIYRVSKKKRYGNSTGCRAS